MQTEIKNFVLLSFSARVEISASARHGESLPLPLPLPSLPSFLSRRVRRAGHTVLVYGSGIRGLRVWHGLLFNSMAGLWIGLGARNRP